MTRGGRNKARDGAERRCIATRVSGPRSGMLRFVVGPEGRIVPDILGRLPGRGIWVSAERTALEQAVAKRLFARAARAQVTVPVDLVADVETMLARRVVELIAMARKAGQAVAGYEKVKSWLVTGQGSILIQASDGSSRGKSKLNTPGDGRYIGMLSAGEIGLAFGRESVIHGAVTAGGLGDRILDEANRLAGFRRTGGVMTAGKE